MSLRLLLLTAGCAALLLPTVTRAQDAGRDAARWERAQRIAQEAIIVDGHIDIPYRLQHFDEDISVETAGGDFDYVRARKGGLDAPFMSIYIPASYQQRRDGGRQLADSLIDMVESFERRWPERFAVVRSPEEVRRNHEQGLVSLPLGMENGAPVRTLADLRHFAERGVSYITLAHSRNNQLSDASYDAERTWNGLSPFGEEVVREMNRLGIMVDVSHLSDDAFRDVLRVSRAPVIASHSSLRSFTPGWERNMNDVMLVQLAKRDGVLMISFGSRFLRGEYHAPSDALEQRLEAELATRGLPRYSARGNAYWEDQRKEHPIGTIDDVVAHIDRAVRLVGVDHVGLGSDFDGVLTLPAGLQDASQYPNLIYELLGLGYSEEEIRKILGENLLRVWAEVQRVADERP